MNCKFFPTQHLSSCSKGLLVCSAVTPLEMFLDPHTEGFWKQAEKHSNTCESVLYKYHNRSLQQITNLLSKSNPCNPLSLLVVLFVACRELCPEGAGGRLAAWFAAVISVLERCCNVSWPSIGSSGLIL